MSIWSFAVFPSILSIAYFVNLIVNCFSISYIGFAYLINCHYCMSRIIRKLPFCICENIGADQLVPEQLISAFVFRYIDSAAPLLPKSKISSLLTASMAVQPSLCLTWVVTRKTGFLARD